MSQPLRRHMMSCFLHDMPHKPKTADRSICAGGQAMRRWSTCLAASAGVWPSRARCCPSQTSCCWTSPPTIWSASPVHHAHHPGIPWPCDHRLAACPLHDLHRLRLAAKLGVAHVQDAQSVAWLERTLAAFKGTVVAVTHDRCVATTYIPLGVSPTCLDAALASYCHLRLHMLQSMLVAALRSWCASQECWQSYQSSSCMDLFSLFGIANFQCVADLIPEGHQRCRSVLPW